MLTSLWEVPIQTVHLSDVIFALTHSNACWNRHAKPRTCWRQKCADELGWQAVTRPSHQQNFHLFPQSLQNTNVVIGSSELRVCSCRIENAKSSEHSSSNGHTLRPTLTNRILCQSRNGRCSGYTFYASAASTTAKNETFVRSVLSANSLPQ